MPIPLLVWGVVVAASALGGAAATVSANERIKIAQQKHANRRRRYETVIRECKEKQGDVDSRFKDLGKTRLEAAVTLGKAVKFLERAKLKERKLFEKFNITPEQFLKFKTASIRASEVLGGLTSAASAGAATAAAVYGLVGTLASASTGTAITTLSGAAAKSATLAWLGGGTLAAGGGGVLAGTAVFGGLVVGPAILAAGLWGLKKAGDIEEQVAKDIAEWDIDESKKRQLLARLDVVLARVAEVKKSTVKMKNELESLLSSSSPDNEYDAYLVAKTAVSLGQILDIAILDKDGRII